MRKNSCQPRRKEKDRLKELKSFARKKFQESVEKIDKGRTKLINEMNSEGRAGITPFVKRILAERDARSAEVKQIGREFDKKFDEGRRDFTKHRKTYPERYL